jgi:hypothetical protein
VKIDDNVEPLVRSALDAAVHRDTERFQAALGAFTTEESSTKAIELVLSVSAFVLFDVYDGKPSSSQATDLAARISEQEQWLEIQTAEVSQLLDILTTGDTSRLTLLADRAAVVAFASAANLLASASRPKEGEWWFNYLDKVEAAVESS